MKKGFTIAEVLITLGIIGIVTVITLPTLIAKHRKNLIETRLKNFYTTINQAIKMAEADYGDKKDWFSPLPEECESDKDSQNCLQTFYDKYLKKYLIVHKVFYNTEYKDDNFNSLWIYFANGSGVKLKYAGHDYIFYPEAAKMQDENRINCKDRFYFGFYPNTTVESIVQNYRNKGIEPYINSNWDGTREDLINKRYCAKLIQLNNWQIPDDYPIKP